MSADNFLVFWEREDKLWEVRMGYLSGWEDPEGDQESIDSYILAHTYECFGGRDSPAVFSSIEEAENFAYEYEMINVVEYGSSFFKRK